jgi:RNA polymerase sigma-70 factor, ECF subfamily
VARARDEPIPRQAVGTKSRRWESVAPRLGTSRSAETGGPAATPTGVSLPALRADGEPAAAAVVRRAQAGDAEAFRVIFEGHIACVRRFCRDLLRDEAGADEAAQETFVRAHGRLQTLENEGALSSWLLGIARLVCLEQRRRSWRLLPFSWGGAGEDEEEASLPTEDKGPTPEMALLGGEADRALDGALATLSTDRRAALLLRLDHGLGYDEIGAAMGWSLAKVKNEIHRARLQLRAQLAGYLGEGA